MTKHTPMDKEAAARIQSAADRHPDSNSARSGFSERAQSAADRAEHDRTDSGGKEEDPGTSPA